jgi:hypothetical protein
MSDLTGTIIAEAETPSAFSERSRSGLSTEMNETAGRRLAWVALTYMIIFVFVSVQDFMKLFAIDGSDNLGLMFFVRWAVAIAGGAVVFRIGRTGRCPRRLTLPDVAVAFQVFATLLPATAEWSWVARGEQEFRELGRVLGFEGAEFLTGFVAPLSEHGIHLGASLRPTWLGVWILIFPLIFPMTFRRTLLSSLLTFAAGLGPMFVALLFVEIPEWMAPSVLPYFLGAAIPTLVCLGLALVGSRVVYRVSLVLAHER